MPFDHLLEGKELSPEQKHVVKLALNITLRKLNLVDRNDPVCEIVARKIIEINKRGASNVVAISEIAIRELGVR